MKKQIRIVGAVVLVALYCIAMGVTNEAFVSSSFEKDMVPSQKKSSPNFSSSLYYPNSQAENIVENYTNLPAPSFKNTFNGFWAIVKTTDELFYAEFYQYQHFFRNFLIRYRKADLIFPFHSFG